MLGRGVLLVCALVFVPPASDAWAQEDTATGHDVPVADTETAPIDASPEPSDDHPIVPLLLGETAPWSGLLVPENTFLGYLQLELKVKELQGILEIRTNLLDEQRNIYETAIRQSFSDGPSWWQENGFTVGIIGGLLFGVGLTVLGVWAVGAV
jgi:hypothetical protein